MSVQYRWPLLTTVILQLAQALSGINVVFSYSSKMFLEAGVSLAMIPFANIGTGLINVIATVVSLFLVERIGRRSLIIYPMAAMVVIFGALTILIEFNEQHKSPVMTLISIVLILVFIICFSIGLGPIPFFYATEVCRPEARDSIQSLGFIANYLGNIILLFFFPALNSMLGGYVFLIFLLLMLFSLVFLWFKMPETKNKAIDEIEKFWNIPIPPSKRSLLTSSLEG